jgi:archaellum component FlaF (FlaF/FlaG flagellin family)
MGFSLIASAAILGVTLFMAVEIITSNVLPTIEEINTSYDDMKERITDQVQSDINITTVSRSPNGLNYDYNISVKNTGSISLKTKNFNVLINGMSNSFTCSHSYIYPENTVYFTILNVAGDEIKRMKIVSDTGIADYYVFNP